MDDTDIFARSLMARFGGGAYDYSKQRAEKFAVMGDQDGHVSWLKVAERVIAIRQLSCHAAVVELKP